MATRPRVPTHSAVQGPVANRGGGVARARGLARLLDDLIRVPGTNIGIGLDPLIGLIPGIGDIVGGVMSSYILLVAVQCRAGMSNDAKRAEWARAYSRGIEEVNPQAVLIYGGDEHRDWLAKGLPRGPVDHFLESWTAARSRVRQNRGGSRKR